MLPEQASNTEKLRQRVLQVDPERVAEFFKPLPPEEELQLHEPQLHQHSKL